MKIREEKNKCVWMTSGLISYKLCAYNYQCDQCLLDKAMRNEEDAASAGQGSYQAVNPDLGVNHLNIRFIEDFFYHQSHCWVRVENSECVKIGIDGILARLISKIKTVVLPQSGDSVLHGLCFSHVIQQRHIVPLISPLTGSILSVNSAIVKKPELILSDFWESGWLVTVKPKNLEVDLQTLVFGKKALEWYKKKEQKITKVINGVLNSSRETLGASMQDGGEIVSDFASALNPEQYYQILDSLSQEEDFI